MTKALHDPVQSRFGKSDIVSLVWDPTAQNREYLNRGAEPGGPATGLRVADTGAGAGRQMPRARKSLTGTPSLEQQLDPPLGVLTSVAAPRGSRSRAAGRCERLLPDGAALTEKVDAWTSGPGRSKAG